MPTANVRYGRPKGSGLDDRQRLESIAALLAANPKLKPTTAIRSLGVEDPSAIRRLRDKFRIEQAKLMANARRTAHPRRQQPATSKKNTLAPARAQSHALVIVTPTANHVSNANKASSVAPAAALFAGWCDMTFAMLSATTQTQAVLAEHWLRLPPVAASIRRQLAINSMATAIYTRKARHPRRLH